MARRAFAVLRVSIITTSSASPPGLWTTPAAARTFDSVPVFSRARPAVGLPRFQVRTVPSRPSTASEAYSSCR